MKKTLVVIDGKSVFYRGYYAMGALSTSEGVPTGGVYGFAAIAMEIVRKLKPTKVVVAWDKAGTSTAKRTEIYPEYKAGRVKPPEDFYAQIPYLKELVLSLGWGFVECDNYEADDLIGTLAYQASPDSSGWQMYIISSDMDMLQVVDENVKMYRVLKGFTNIEEIDVKAVEEKYGIKKEQFLDLKALKGDNSDNIPGVPGIGEKGAVKLLNEFGSLEGIYENIEKISGSMRKKLEEGKASAEMSYKLAKIMTDAPVKLEELPDFTIKPEQIIYALRKLEFRSLERKFRKWLEEDDLEVEMAKGAEEQKEEKRELPEDVIVSWDVKGLMHRDEEIAERILKGAKFYDLSQGKFLLKPLERVKEERELTLFEDREELRREYWRQQDEFKKYPELNKIFVQFDLPLIPVLYRVEKQGMLISREYFKELRAEYEKEVHKIEQKIYSLAGVEFNINSPIQLGMILFEKLGLPTKGIKKSTRGFSTGAKELDKLKDLHPIIPVLVEYREAAKLLNTYIIPLPNLADKEGRVHTTFTQNVTATGRLSSVNPNLQNIPIRTEEGRRIREGFVAPEGKILISADYAQFELRLAAVLSGDEKLTEDFNAGIDIHTKTAAEVFKVKMEEVSKLQRRAAKVINFGVLYGMSAKGLSDATGMTVPEAKAFIDGYFELRKPIREKLNKILEQARNQGYVETYFGRRRPTPDVKSSNFLVRAAAERAAQNMPIQGTEADLMKRAMIKVERELPEGAKLVMQVHDSLIVEAEKEKEEEVKGILKRIMEGIAPELKIKLAVDVKSGRNWGEI
ncbi:DNA polymerase I [Candidatus Saccharibacteria bacterium]|nr:DNA polymerase I [Candidatus Saccharibacteria bacterium]